MTRANRSKPSAESVANARGYSDADLAEVRDFPELTPEELATAQPFSVAFPELAASIRRPRGKQRAPTKASVTLRLDRAVLEHFKRQGRGYQVRMGEALRKAAGL